MESATVNLSTWVVNQEITLVVNAFYTESGKPIKREIVPALAEQLDQWKQAAQALIEGGTVFLTTT